jgi:hypothetical protein
MFGKTVFDFSKIAEFRVWVAAIAVMILFSVEIITKTKKIPVWYIKKSPSALRLASYGLLLAVIILLGAYDNKSFIYFQF